MPGARGICSPLPNRQSLIAALFEHTNRRIGFDGELPTTPDAMTAMVHQVLSSFDTVAPVIAELLALAEGRQARLGAIAVGGFDEVYELDRSGRLDPMLKGG